MRQITMLGITILIISMLACGQSSQNNAKPETPANWKTISETDYHMAYPDSFEIDKSGQMGMSFILLSKQTSQQDLFRENVNLITQNLAGQNVSLDRYVEISEGQVQTMIVEGNLIESKRIKKGDSEYHRVIYTGKQGQYSLKWLQHFWVENEQAYVLTLTCEQNQYDNYVDIGEKILNTFEIK